MTISNHMGQIHRMDSIHQEPGSHETLEGKPPVEVLLGKDPIKERSNLRPIGQKVICYDYNWKEKEES